MVRHHKRVFADGVFEPVKQPVLLHAPQQVGEISLVPLHGVMLGRRATGDTQIEVGDPVFGAKRFDDLRRRLILENAAV
jgi:hypothetical protein